MSDDNEARTIRHELRTPVNHIVGYAELLLEEEDLAPTLVAGLGDVREIAREVLALVAGVAASDHPSLVALDRLVANLEGAARSLPGLGATESARPDIDHIVSAADRLRSLVAVLSGGTTSSGAPRTAAAGPATGAGDATILVVDDDEGNREVLARRLVRLGYHVMEAADGRAALAVLAESDIDLVLLDLMMPELDGFGVLEVRRLDPALRDIPVIMISAVDQADGLVRCIELGAEDYLPKPFDPVLLKARIGACLEKKRLRDAEKALLATVSRQAAELRGWNEDLERRVAEKLREVERLSRMERFLPPQLAQIIAQGGDELLRSHRSEVTVLFCDLRGFTAFSESAEPEEVMGVLQQMHDTVGPLVFELGGTLAQFTGDGMMVFFNDPVACDEPAWRAVQLGLGMRDGVAELAIAWGRRGYDLALGVGIAIGHATCGQYGFEGRFEYSAIGTVTNLAARLCGEAKGGEVLVSQPVAALIEGRAVVEYAGELALKGFARPVAAHRVAGARVY